MADGFEGRCLCGAVAYRGQGPFEAVGRCHCRECRKASGAEFATNGTVPADTFEILRGEDRLRHFESSPDEFRVFCGDCGSPLWKRFGKNPSVVRLRLGCLDTPFTITPAGQIFTDEKMAITRVDESIPCFPRKPPTTR